MADDKKNIPEVAPPAEAPASAVENAAVPEQPALEPVLTDAEAVMLEHKGQVALFEMGEAVPDPADAVTHAEVEEPAAPKVPKAEQEQPPMPGKDDPAPEKPAMDKGGAPAGAEVTPEPSAPRDATRAEKEEIVYLNLSDLHPFKNHPFGVLDDAEMQGLVESVKAAGVNQPALVRPREDGGYEIIAGHRRQRASELAGFANMPCIVRNMTDDEAILALAVAGAENAGTGKVFRQEQIPDRNEQALPQSVGRGWGKKEK